MFAYVPQGNCLLSGTAREVVAFADGDGAPDDARVRDALYAACADEFVDGLPGGLDARLGERGAALSEGQRQRLAVARAVYSGAPVLLLDEATSALDTACEERMIRRLRELPDRTVLMACLLYTSHHSHPANWNRSEAGGHRAERQRCYHVGH